MIIPVRCFSCGKVLFPPARVHRLLLIWLQVIGDLWERYLKLIDEGITDGSVEAQPLRPFPPF